ncbi:MAG: hypothetical protein GOMPHAMPRED_007909 [Gomphillus americanus]|uniref:Laccase n=1 Tax=Gomphillus americanus TaxID=1940652 RepID=A0A8H3EX69_9LECA|nr:MAG: hypothetical protein GOMPHAMPRED_007909 [Gomphillus americanus]
MSWLLNLIPALSQVLTNGLSTLGTLQQGPLAPFLTNNPLPSGYPWGTRTVYNTNPYEIPPFTGVVRPYTFTISRGNIAPDGVNRSVILVNGAFPGPTIEANWGDTIQVTVNNQLTDEGTALHWHGFLQKKTQYYDGVPAVSQCPIAPGKSLTYTFQADLYGSSWYHSHYSAQYAAGIFGPMVIHGPTNALYDIDLGPVMLSDWYHRDYFSLVEQTMTPGPPVKSDNNLINGKGVFNCSSTSLPCTNNAGLSKFVFTPGKTHRLRLVNSGAEGTQQFSIDGHNLTVIANDFVPVTPYTVQSVTLGIGQRSDVLVTANTNNASAAYWMRSTLVCSLTNQPFGLAAVYYNKANTSATPTSVAPTIPQQCDNDALTSTTPFFPFGAQPQPATTQQFDITFGPNSTTPPISNLFYMNGVSFRGNYNAPVLLLSNAGNNSYPLDPEWNVYNFGSNSSMRFVVYNHFPATHPMHLHGHNFFVLNVGNGQWDGSIINANNPQRRDVQILPGQNAQQEPGFIVLQINADNPGVWPFHCHIAWHVSAGLYVNILERPADIARQRFPQTPFQTCKDWAAFTNTTVIDQIDSGL